VQIKSPLSAWSVHWTRPWLPLDMSFVVKAWDTRTVVSPSDIVHAFHIIAPGF